MRLWIYEKRWRLILIWFVWYGSFKLGGNDLKVAFIGVMVFFFGLFIFYAAYDLLRSIGGWLKPEQNFNINIENSTPGHPDVEGTARHPDPTAPTHEDWAGIITTRIERGRKR